MNLTNSWTNHFILIGSSDAANINMAFFSDAIKPNQTKNEKINYLVKEDNTVVLLIGKVEQIKYPTASKNLGAQELARP